MCVRQLRMFIDTYDDVPFKALSFLAGQINYGGRVTDDWDRRTLMCILGSYYTPEILRDGYVFSESGVYHVPEDGPLGVYTVRAVLRLTRGVGSEGICARRQSRRFQSMTGPRCLACTRTPTSPSPSARPTVRPSRVGSLLFCGFSRLWTNASVAVHAAVDAAASRWRGRQVVRGYDRRARPWYAVCDVRCRRSLSQRSDVLARLPPRFDMDAVTKKYPFKYDDCMNTVLVQDCYRFNALYDAVRGSLQSIRKAIKGEVVMSSDLERMGSRFVARTLCSGLAAWCS
jgi:dynein heavy chain